MVGCHVAMTSSSFTVPCAWRCCEVVSRLALQVAMPLARLSTAGFQAVVSHVQVVGDSKAAGNMGPFGSALPSRPSKQKLDPPVSQNGTAGQDAQPSTSDDAEERGRWGEGPMQGQASQQAPEKDAAGESQPNGADVEQQGRWGEASQSEAGQDSKGAEPRDLPPPAAPPPVALPPATLPPHLGARLQFGSVPNGAHAADEKGSGPDPTPAVAASKQQPSALQPSAAPEQRRASAVPPEAAQEGGTERRWSSEWPALSKDDNSHRRGDAGERTRRGEKRAEVRPERDRSSTRRERYEPARSNDPGEMQANLLCSIRWTQMHIV